MVLTAEVTRSGARASGSAPSPPERELFSAVYDHVPQRLVPVARAVTVLGGHEVVWPLAVLASAVAYRDGGRWRGALRPVAWLAVTAGSRRLLADRLRRHRPDRAAWRDHASGFSCPSRHATLAVAGWGIAATVLPRRWRRRGVPVVAGIAVSVGLSRVVLGVHWPGDVVAGWAFGATALALHVITRDAGGSR